MPDVPLTARRVLFVDDEPAVLTGLNRMLRSLHGEIVAEFVHSGAAALERLQREAFDVVVADIRMPGMDGAQLLGAVRHAHPQLVRVVLSGHADVATALRLVPDAHQCLAKPCDARALRAAIDRALCLQQLLHDNALQIVVGELGALPAAPTLYREFAKLLADPKATAHDLDNLLAPKLVISAALIKLANAPSFSLPRRVASIDGAIHCLGSYTLGALLVAVLAVDTLGSRAANADRAPVAAIDHALWSANLAAQLFADLNARETAFTAALLQNIGESWLQAHGSDSALRATQHAQAHGQSLHDAERTLGLPSHAHLGAYLLESWGLPYFVVEAVAHHHDPAGVAHDKLEVVDAVYVATLVADHYLHAQPAALELARARLDVLGAGARFGQLVKTAEHWLAIAALSVS